MLSPDFGLSFFYNKTPIFNLRKSKTINFNDMKSNEVFWVLLIGAILLYGLGEQISILIDAMGWIPFLVIAIVIYLIYNRNQKGKD